MNTHKIIIKNVQNVITNQAEFENIEAAQSWLDYHTSIETFLFEDKVVPAHVDLDGKILEPSYVVAATHTYKIVDVSAEAQQEEINKQAQAFLDATDWLVIRALERGEELSVEFKAERDAARLSIVK